MILATARIGYYTKGAFSYGDLREMDIDSIEIILDEIDKLEQKMKEEGNNND